MDFVSTKIMGILNITPDSFSDGGEYNSNFELRISKFLKQGVDIIDIGGESTGPGSPEVSAEEELERLRPVIDYVASNKLTDRALFSVDTYKAPVAEYALEHGFGMVNDVTALRGDPRMISVLLEYKPYVVLMYAKDNSPRTTREDVDYDDVVVTIKSFLAERIEILLKAGFPKERVIIDPGMGAFVSAKPEYSFEVIERLPELRELGYPILVGVSRKSFLGGKLEDRDQPSVTWSLKAIQNGASIIRVHNTKMMLEAIGR